MLRPIVSHQNEELLALPGVEIIDVIGFYFSEKIRKKYLRIYIGIVVLFIAINDPRKNREQVKTLIQFRMIYININRLLA